MNGNAKARLSSGALCHLSSFVYIIKSVFNTELQYFLIFFTVSVFYYSSAIKKLCPCRYITPVFRVKRYHCEVVFLQFQINIILLRIIFTHPALSGCLIEDTIRGYDFLHPQIHGIAFIHRCLPPELHAFFSDLFQLREHIVI